MKKSKSAVLAFVLIAAALVSCKNEIDIYAPLGGLADGAIPASYSYTVIDTTSFTATVYEYTFVSGGDSVANSGTYVVTQLSGQGAATRKEETFTYKRGAMTEDNLYYHIELTYADGTVKDVLWGSASIVDGDMVLNGAKRADHLITISKNLTNRSWTYVDSALYIDENRDTIPYMLFTSTVANLTLDEIDEINAYLRSIEGQAAIQWFNEHLEILGLSNEYAVTQDSVRKAKNPNEDGTYKSLYFAWSEDTIVSLTYDTLGLKYMHEESFRFNFADGVTNAGYHAYGHTDFGREFYTKGDASAVKVVYYLETLTPWGITFNGSLLNAKSMTVIAKVEGKDGIASYAISGLDADKGTITIENLKCKLADDVE